jgi:hypothetical protein
MSWITGTQAEAISSSSANGSALANSTVATSISPATGAAFLPANFFMPSYGQSKRVLVKAWGVVSTTGTPNLTIAVTANTTQGTYNASGIIATSAATAQGSGVSNIPWDLEVMISCVGAGSSGTFLAMGMFQAFSTMTAGGGMRVSSSAANPNTAFTLSTQSAYYLELAATWGTASASNTITCYDYSVLGLN